VQKGGFQAHAARLGLAVLCPDTSPRGADVPGSDSSDYAIGIGAGFYVDATQEPWAPNFQMESYVTAELLPLATGAFGLDARRVGVMGHSMGGHGALALFFKKPDVFRSVSALAPICAPTRAPWGRNAFETYLGSVEAGKAHDACELVGTGARPCAPILVDQGAADEFLRTELMPELFKRACAEAGQPLTLRVHAGYDHSYLFVASFFGEHLEHHVRQLSQQL
jgi:S-formylglutathione hydrolase